MRRWTVGIALALVVIVICVAVVVVRLGSQWRSQYEAVRAGSVVQRDLVYVDRETFEHWRSLIESPDRETLRTSTDAFSASFAVLPDAGFDPNIEGYLRVLSIELPPAEKISIPELPRWRTVAGLRMVLSTSGQGDIQVYKSGGIFRGFRFPPIGDGKSIHLGMLENGSYAEYLSSRKPASVNPPPSRTPSIAH